MLQVTESRGVISIAQYDSNGNLCGEIELDECAAGWYRQLIAEVDHMEQFESSEIVARFRRAAAITALSRMGVEV